VRILLVEPYHGGSHQVWADGYAASSRHDVEIIGHEARFWKWRMRGAHLTLGAEAVDRFGPSPHIDALLVSSMMDVAGFLGATRRTFESVPVAVYFHENQFTYPLSPLDRPDLTYAMTNWSSAAVADRAIFNSEFHRRQFFAEARRFLRQFPDHRHRELIDPVERRSAVLAPGIDLARIDRRRPGTRGRQPPLLLWNQRWEHDKGPDRFVAAVEAIVHSGTGFRVAVTGERFVSSPECFDRLPALLGDRLVHFGFAPDDEYVDLLLEAAVVVSTAEQEFFGIAIAEAMYAGAFPVLPARLVYPERIPPELEERCLYTDDVDLVNKLRGALEAPAVSRSAAASLAPTVAGFDWQAIAPQYDTMLDALVTED
jgi:glycosyltransferase involved in cell wall biosynthesis